MNENMLEIFPDLEQRDVIINLPPREVDAQGRGALRMSTEQARTIAAALLQVADLADGLQQPASPTPWHCETARSHALGGWVLDQNGGIIGTF